MPKASKGSAFEREFSKRLSLWWSQEWSNGPDDFIFWRTSNSGGRATTRAKAGKKADKHCGDIGAVDSRGDFLLSVISFELKRGYAKHTIHDILDKPEGAKLQTFEEWFIKADRDRERAGALYWVLVARRDRRNALMYLPDDLFNCFNAKVKLSLEVICSFLWNSIQINIIKLDDFFEHVHPEHIRALLNKKK